MAELSKEAALSCSAFFERFSREVGLAPMEYLLTWRMAMAKFPCEEPGDRPQDRRLYDRPTLAPEVTRSSSSCSNISDIPPSIPAMAPSRASFEG